MKNKGFTLIEFIVIIAIMGVLLAVVTPSFVTKRQENENNELKNQKIVIDKSLKLCYAIEGSYPPASWNDPTHTPPQRDWVDYLVEKNYLPAFEKVKYNFSGYNQATGDYIMEFK